MLVETSVCSAILLSTNTDNLNNVERYYVIMLSFRFADEQKQSAVKEWNGWIDCIRGWHDIDDMQVT